MDILPQKERINYASILSGHIFIKQALLRNIGKSVKFVSPALLFYLLIIGYLQKRKLTMEMVKEHLGAIFSLYIFFPLVNMCTLYLQLELRIKAKHFSYLEITDSI